MKKEFEKKLVLNKQTIARLNPDEMTTAHGGIGTLLVVSVEICEVLLTITESIIEHCSPFPDIYTIPCTDKQTCYVERVGCVVQR